MTMPNVPLPAAATSVPIINAGLKYVNGLQITWVDPFHLLIAPGAARDSDNVNDLILQQSVDSSGNPIFVGGLPAGAVIGTNFIGANGIDSPLIEDKFYAVYIIGDSNGYKPTAAILSLSSVQPTLPFGYDIFRRIGWTATASNSTNLEKWYQSGEGEERVYYYDIASPVLNPGTSASFVEAFADIPPLTTQAYFDVAFTSAAAADDLEFLPFGSGQTVGIIRFGSGFVGVQIDSIVVPTIFNAGNASFLYKVTSGSSVVLSSVGFEDILS